MSSQKTFNETALEFMKIYFSCHPGKLPEDKQEAFKELMQMHAQFKEKLIEQGIRRNEDFFSDKL